MAGGQSRTDIPRRYLPPVVSGIAFLALLILIVVLAVNSLVQLNTSHRLDGMTQDHARRINVITRVQFAVNVCTESLLRMALTQDAVERAAVYAAFKRATQQVESSREELRQLGLGDDERAEFDAQSALVVQLQTAQNAVTERVNAGQTDAAMHLLATQALPLQDSVNTQLTQMRSRYREDTRQARSEAEQQFASTWNLTAALGVAAIVMGALVGWFSLRHLLRVSRQIEIQIAQLERSRAALKREASHDSLTGLPNRRLFYDRMQQAIRRARRHRSKVGVLYIDLDRFKEINDTHGHHVGDAVLTEVARRLSRSVREADSLARLGGDEFAVLLDNVRGREDCLAAALNIERTLAEDSSFYGLNVDISASVGQALYPDDGEDEDALLRAADAAMYRIKSGSASERQGRLLFAE
jgi:diguanylate cyclase (GGDEF)-like protein